MAWTEAGKKKEQYDNSLKVDKLLISLGILDQHIDTISQRITLTAKEEVNQYNAISHLDFSGFGGFPSVSGHTSRLKKTYMSIYTQDATLLDLSKKLKEKIVRLKQRLTELKSANVQTLPNEPTFTQDINGIYSEWPQFKSLLTQTTQKDSNFIKEEIVIRGVNEQLLAFMELVENKVDKNGALPYVQKTIDSMAGDRVFENNVQLQKYVKVMTYFLSDINPSLEEFKDLNQKEIFIKFLTTLHTQNISGKLEFKSLILDTLDPEKVISSYFNLVSISNTGKNDIIKYFNNPQPTPADTSISLENEITSILGYLHPKFALVNHYNAFEKNILNLMGECTKTFIQPTEKVKAYTYVRDLLLCFNTYLGKKVSLKSTVETDETFIVVYLSNNKIFNLKPSFNNGHHPRVAANMLEKMYFN
jgi:hypothetical protein